MKIICHSHFCKKIGNIFSIEPLNNAHVWRQLTCTHCILYMQTGGVACTCTLVCGVRSISKYILIIHLKIKCMHVLKSPIALITTETVYKLLRFYNSCSRYVTLAKCKFRSTCSYTGIFFGPDRKLFGIKRFSLLLWQQSKTE